MYNKLFFECDKFIFLKKYFNFFVCTKSIKGKKLIEEDKNVENVYFIRKGEYQVSFKKSLFEIIQIINDIEGKDNTNDLEIEEMKCNL